MPSLPPELRSFAETPDRFTLLSSDVERYADERVCVIQGVTWAGVAGVHVGGAEVEALVAEVRARVPASKNLTWWLGPSSEPADLVERLLQLGLQSPSDRADVLHALACVTPPPPGPPEIEVRTVTALEDFVTATELLWEAFDSSPERRELERPHLEASFDAQRRAGVPMSFVADLEGRPAGMARSVYAPQGVFMIAGCTAPWARGRGVYRALVRARWDDAVARGTPALVTEANPETSLPILLRLGFEDVCVVRRLEDPRA